MATLLRPLRIAFVHPDLGIGGAERLIVDAAAGLQELGHSVEVITSHYDPARSFLETQDGTLDVRVLGDTLFPRAFFGDRFHILAAILRQLHLFLSLFFLTIRSSSAFQPPDIYVVDQLSTAVPLLRFFTRTRVIFYCHFPDLLLSPGRGGAIGEQSTRRSILRAIYRAPIDRLEEATTGTADRILVNSGFTAQVFQRTFPHVKRQLQIVYPGIDVQSVQGQGKKDENAKSGQVESGTGSDSRIVGDRPTFLSINRFEVKKNVRLAIEAFAVAKQEGNLPDRIRLVIAGGWSTRRVSDL